MLNEDRLDLKCKKQTHQGSAITKFMGLFLIVGSLSLFGLWFNYDFLPSLIKKQIKLKVSKTEQKNNLQILWEQDIQEMSNKQIFHSGFSSIGKVRVFMLDANLHSQLKNLKAPFKQKKNGQNLLEVSFMSHYSNIDDSEKIIIQYNLTDKDNGNMFWEHSRTVSVPTGLLNK